MPDIISAALAASLHVAPAPPYAGDCVFFSPGLDQFVNTCGSPLGGKGRRPGGIDATGEAMRLASSGGTAPWDRRADPIWLNYPIRVGSGCCGGTEWWARQNGPEKKPAVVDAPGTLIGGLTTLAVFAVLAVMKRRSHE